MSWDFNTPAGSWNFFAFTSEVKTAPCKGGGKTFTSATVFEDCMGFPQAYVLHLKDEDLHKVVRDKQLRQELMIRGHIWRSLLGQNKVARRVLRIHGKHKNRFKKITRKRVRLSIKGGK